MKVAQLFSSYPHPKWGEAAQSDITGLNSDSRSVSTGEVFVAIRGRSFDGHSALSEVCSRGVPALVVEDDSSVPKDFLGAVLKVANTKVAYHQLASRFYGEPAQEMFCVGVTGTNGKSTVTYMVEQVLNHFDWPTGVIGTIDHHIGDKKWKSDLTTPSAQVLHKRLAEFASVGAQAMCMEISSIGLDQERVGAISFDAVVFTNLTRDHLDYHVDMESYLQCKERLFNEVLADSKKENAFAIINGDDSYGKKLKINPGAQVWFYGQSENADLRFEVLEESFAGLVAKIFTPRGDGKLFLPMVGRHNLYNATAAIGVGLAAGVSLSQCLTAFESFSGVPGRLQSIPNEKGMNVFVDYAHTSDALENILKVLSQIRNQMSTQGKRKSRVITVFGCGGDRDRGKRPMMAEVAEKYSDVLFVTSDNPRTENPQQIINDILEGLSGNASRQVEVHSEVDRRLALQKAISQAKEGDVVVIAGKGHEDYQILGTEKVPFDDFAIAEELLNC